MIRCCWETGKGNETEKRKIGVGQYQQKKIMIYQLEKSKY